MFSVQNIVAFTAAAATITGARRFIPHMTQDAKIIKEQQRKDYLTLKSIALMDRLVNSSQEDWTGEMHAHPQENYFLLRDKYKREDTLALKNLLALEATTPVIDFVTPHQHSKAHTPKGTNESSVCYFQEIYSFYGRTIPLEILFAIKSMEEYEYFGCENSKLLDAFIANILKNAQSDVEASAKANKLILRRNILDHLSKTKSVAEFKTMFLQLPQDVRNDLKEGDINGHNIFTVLFDSMAPTNQHYTRDNIIEILEFLRDNNQLTLKELLSDYSYLCRSSGYGFVYKNNLLACASAGRTFRDDDGRIRVDYANEAKLCSLLASLLKTPENLDLSKFPDFSKFMAKHGDNPLFKDQACDVLSIASDKVIPKLTA